MNNTRLLELSKAISALVGRECWSAVAGAGTGSVVSLQFGEKVRRSQRFTNPYLSPEAQEFDGEYILFIECAWRLDSETAVVCSWTDDNSADGSMLAGLRQLQGQKVTDYKLSTPAQDLDLEFEGGLIIHVFCDQSGTPDADNYAFIDQASIYVVESRGTIAKTRRIREELTKKRSPS